jgi:ribonuclease T1
MKNLSRVTMTNRIRLLSAAALAALSLLAASAATARTASCAVGESIAARDLPKQGRDTLALIESGGPFASERDGIVFGNRERILPRERRGFYREYTVRTPGVKNRGARRIVCGGADSRSTDQCYYSDDHYKSFKCIAR